MSGISEVIAAEHQARCDLIDALFYVDLVAGKHGPGITPPEKILAEHFAERILARYPMQKGQRFAGLEAELGRASRPCHNCGSTLRSLACHICGFPIDDPADSEFETEVGK